MRIALIVNKFPVLSETFILNQIVGIIEQKYDIDIFADKPKKNEKNHSLFYQYFLFDKTTYFPKRHHNLLIRYLKVILLFIINGHNNIAMAYADKGWYP